MRLDVVRVRIAAVLVVREDHVRTELAHQLHERCRGAFERLQGEAALGQRGQRIALGQSGIRETDPAVFDVQGLGGLGHFLAAQTRQVAIGHGNAFHLGVQNGALLTAGARGHHDACTQAHVMGHGCRALAGLVIRVGVDGQEPEFRIIRHGTGASRVGFGQNTIPGILRPCTG